MPLRRVAALAAVLLAATARADDTPAPMSVEQPAPRALRVAPTGTLRVGTYADGDRTVVFRALGAVALTGRRWSFNAGLSADVVSSASVDVRSSAGLSKVDVVTTASGTSTSGGRMFDRRLQATLGGGWHRDDGKAINLSASYANERDYNSIAVGINGAFDVNHRNTTLLGGLGFTHNWIASMLDATFAQQSMDLAWSAGVAQVLGPRDALRVRYDGALTSGYQASPYRSVRFGNWTASTNSYNQFVFASTTGTLPEQVPDLRVRNALIGEWLHALGAHWSLFPQLRLGIDTWRLMSAGAGLDLRGAWDRWRVQLGYRFYAQSSTDFYQARYVDAASTYAYYTSDKELGRQYGHLAHLDLSRVMRPSRYLGDPRVLVDLHLVAQYYQYPEFPLLSSRWGGFAELGVTWE